MTAERLQRAALIRFAEQGYNATTMNEIAGDVGIKKASIYAHFKNKDELFLSLIPIMVNDEFEYIKTMIPGGADISAQLYHYLESIDNRFDSSHQVQFWLRILFAPPIHLHNEVVTPMHAFMDALEAYVYTRIAETKLGQLQNGLTCEVITANYMALVDSLHTELLFGGHEKYKKRLDATWQVFQVAVNAP